MKLIDEFEALRKEMYAKRGIEEVVVVRDPLKVSGEIQQMVQALLSVVEMARPRLVMGGIRYGSKPWEHKALMDYMQTKFDLYRKTGNFEMLVDMVNFCAIEWTLKTHPNFHFEAKDRK